MKTRRKLITVVTLCLVGLIFCFPWTVLAGFGPNSGSQQDPLCPEGNPVNEPCSNEKIVKSVSNAILIAGLPNEINGPVDAYLFINGVLYVATLTPRPTDDEFIGAEVENIIKWKLPPVIADQFGVDLGSTGRVVIAEAKDVTNFLNAPRVNAFNNSEFSTYKNIISCVVKISFIITKKK
jgi:hypothetical protein